jgi:hypothetical protein
MHGFLCGVTRVFFMRHCAFNLTSSGINIFGGKLNARHCIQFVIGKILEGGGVLAGMNSHYVCAVKSIHGAQSCTSKRCIDLRRKREQHACIFVKKNCAQETVTTHNEENHIVMHVKNYKSYYYYYLFIYF